MTPFRRGSCGHYIPAGIEPAGYDVEDHSPVYLCEECRAKARNHPMPSMETKGGGSLTMPRGSTTGPFPTPAEMHGGST